jgi:hypothetical protein
MWMKRTSGEGQGMEEDINWQDQRIVEEVVQVWKGSVQPPGANGAGRRETLTQERSGMGALD